MTRDQLIDEMLDILMAADMDGSRTLIIKAHLSHPRISLALAVLDRIGDQAADALIAGTAAVAQISCTEAMRRAWLRVDVSDDCPDRDWEAMLAAGRLDRGGA